MDLRLEGKRALVTGGSLGIGRAIATELAAEGVAVAINARNADRLAAVAEEIGRSTGGRVIPVAGDLERSDEPDRVVAAAVRELGGLDILINNAGASPAGRLHDLSDEAWRHCIELKLMGYVRCARAATPGMKERRWGRVVNINGRSGHQPRAWYMSGGAVNAAILNFTKALAEEMAPFNVLVNAVNPGPIQTPRWDSHMQQGAATLNASSDEVLKRMIESVPLGRVGTPEECSGVVAFLCSDRASFIHGSFINVDGGGTRWLRRPAAMPTLTRPDGAVLRYRTDGDGGLPPLLLIHGLAESGEAFADWLPRLAGSVRVIRPDLRGYGNSTIPEGYAFRFDDLVADMAALLEQVAAAPAHVVGGKIGGAIAMQLAAERPALVRSLSAVGAPASLVRMRDQTPGWIAAIRRNGVEAWVRATTGNRMGSALPAEKLEWWVRLMSRTSPATLESFLAMVPGVDVTPRLPQIAAPTLVLTASGSGLGSVEEVRRWQQLIPNSELQAIEADSYHVAGSHPAECADAVLRFIARH